MPDARGSPGDSEQKFISEILKKTLGALTDGFGEIIRAATRILVAVFGPDDPPPSIKLSVNSRRVASITGMILAGVAIYVYIKLYIYKDPKALETAIEALGGQWATWIILVISLLCCLFVAVAWGEHCDDRAKYKIIVSSLFLTLLVFVFVLVLLSIAGNLWP